MIIIFLSELSFPRRSENGKTVKFRDKYCNKGNIYDLNNSDLVHFLSNTNFGIYQFKDRDHIVKFCEGLDYDKSRGVENSATSGMIEDLRLIKPEKFRIFC